MMSEIIRECEESQESNCSIGIRVFGKNLRRKVNQFASSVIIDRSWCPEGILRLKLPRLELIAPSGESAPQPFPFRLLVARSLSRTPEFVKQPSDFLVVWGTLFTDRVL